MKFKNLIIVFIIFGFYKLYSKNCWNWENPLPQGNDLYSVFVIDSNHIVAVGESETIISTMDRGKTWNVISKGSVYLNYYSVKFIDNKFGCIVGDWGTILITTDGGETWNKQTINTFNKLFDVDFVNKNVGWIVGENGTLLHTKYGVDGWDMVSVNISVDLNSIFFISEDAGWISGDHGLILCTKDGGNNWSSISIGEDLYLTDIFFVSKDIGWVTGSNSKIYRTVDGGITWIPLDLEDVVSIYFKNESIGWGAVNGCIYLTMDGGNNWSKIYNSNHDRISSLCFFNDYGWFVGKDGLILYSFDNGKKLKKVNKGYKENFKSIYISNKNEIYVAGEHGNIIKYNENGLLSILVVENINENLNDIHVDKNEDIWIVGNHGIVLKIGEDFKTWHRYETNVSNNLKSIFFNNEQEGWIVGDKNTVLKTVDFGNNWISKNIDVKGDFSSIFFVNNNVGWIVGTGELGGFLKHISGKVPIILNTTDGGENWHIQDITRNPLLKVFNFIKYFFTQSRGLNDIYFFNNKIGWAVGMNRTIYKTTNSGKDWSFQGIENDNQFNLIYYNRRLMSKYNITYSNFNAIRFIDNENGFIVGSEGEIFITNNGGKNWYPENSGTKESLESIDYIQNEIWVSGSNGTILYKKIK